jgi:hypothetical protein
MDENEDDEENEVENETMSVDDLKRIQEGALQSLFDLFLFFPLR